MNILSPCFLKLGILHVQKDEKLNTCKALE